MLLLIHVLLWLSELKGIPTAPSFILTDESKKEGLLFSTATDLQLTLDGEMYLLDGKEGQVLKFDLQGNLLKQIGRHGQGPQDWVLASLSACFDSAR